MCCTKSVNYCLPERRISIYIGRDLLVKLKNVLIGDCAGVDQIHRADHAAKHQVDGQRDHVVENGDGVWNAVDRFVVGKLGDEVAGMQVIGNRHPQTQKQTVVVAGQQL